MHDSVFGDTIDTILSSLAERGGATITIGTDIAETQKAQALAHRFSHVYFCAGIHPVDTHMNDFDQNIFESLVSDPKCVGVGECGLDYFHPASHDWESGEKEEKERQEKLFRTQIEIALKHDLPLMIHGRPSKNTYDAYEDILEILTEYKKNHGKKLRGNVHFFVGTKDIAKRFIELDFTLSFTGVITFTQAYDDVISHIPTTHIQAETDAPWVAPVPFRGKTNDSEKVLFVIEKIAHIKGVSVEEMKHTLRVNAERVFGI